MWHLIFRLRNWSLLVFIFLSLFISSCFWINEPNADEIGSLELSADEISGETYSYKIFLNDSSNQSFGYGFLVKLNNRELVRQCHENIDGEIEKYKTANAAMIAAETMIDYLKNTARQQASQKSNK